MGHDYRVLSRVGDVALAGVTPDRRVGRSGDRARPSEFAEVYDDHVRSVFGFIGYRVRSREEAEDLTQQTFERALRAWRRFDPTRSSPLTWLLAIARNLLIDHYRAAGSVRHEALDQAVHPSADPTEAIGISPEVERALGLLSDREREILALRYGADLTGPEIAEVTRLSLANVQQIISRSLRRMRAELERDQPDANRSRGEWAGAEDADDGGGQQGDAERRISRDHQPE